MSIPYLTYRLQGIYAVYRGEKFTFLTGLLLTTLFDSYYFSLRWAVMMPAMLVGAKNPSKMIV